MREPLSIDVAFDDAMIFAGVRDELGMTDGRPALPLVGERYRLIERLGEGSFGSVYRARDLQLDRDVALKTLPLDDEVKSGREGRALAQLTHPNVVRIYDHGVADDYWYLVLELLEGRDLSRWLADGPRTPDELVSVFVEAGKGLAAAHAAGLVHRDFKPSNVMVTVDGRVVVVDFGQARRVDTEETNGGRRSRSGTLAYMAPERISGELGDGRSDQFSFCVALWEALAGSNPFGGDDPDSRFASIMLGPGRPPVGGSLGRVLRRGLSRTRGDRYPSMDALLAELEPTSARRRPFVIAATIAAAILIGVGLLPEGPTTGRGEADATEGPARVGDLLDQAEAQAHAGEAAAAVSSLQQALDQAHGELVVRCADRAMKVADTLLEAGHRPEAAEAYGLAYEGFSSQGLDELARWALEQASVAMDPVPRSPRSR